MMRLLHLWSLCLLVVVKGDIVLSDSDTNSCPTNYQKITDSLTCRAAMEFVPETAGEGAAWDGEESDAEWPRGCYYFDQEYVYFNSHPTGQSEEDSQLLCVDATFQQTLTAGGEVLFVGDSDIDYWPTAYLEGSYNVGVGGSTCEDALNEIDDVLAKFAPAWVVLVCGENDLIDESVGTTLLRLENLVDTIVASGARVLYIGTKPEPGTGSLHAEYRDYDEAVRNNLAQYNTTAPSFVMVDSYSGFEAAGNPDSLYQGDRLHLSAEGYSLWDSWVETALGATGTRDESCAVWLSGVCDHLADPYPTSSPSLPSNFSTDVDDGASGRYSCLLSTTILICLGTTWRLLR